MCCVPVTRAHPINIKTYIEQMGEKMSQWCCLDWLCLQHASCHYINGDGI